MAYAILVLVIYSPIVLVPMMVFSVKRYYLQSKNQYLATALIAAICLFAWVRGFGDEYLMPTWWRLTGQECRIIVPQENPFTEVRVRFIPNHALQCERILKFGSSGPAECATDSPFGKGEACVFSRIQIYSEEGHKLHRGSSSSEPTEDGGFIWTFKTK